MLTPLPSPVMVHPRLLFNQAEVRDIRERAASPLLKPVADRVCRAADENLAAAPLIPSVTLRGQPDPPGEVKGIAAARSLQSRVINYCMAFTLTGKKAYRDGAVAELNRAVSDWRIWVDTAHPPPYDLMTGETAATFAIAYDWLYQDLSPDERRFLRQGAEKRALKPYLEALRKETWFYTSENNWNTVCNGGAALLALALQGESRLSEEVLAKSVPGMDHYWGHLAKDGGWDEGTGYWAYGHRYAFLAAEALRRSGRPGGQERFDLPGTRNTGYFPIAFNPGRKASVSFGDSNSRADDAIYYLLGRTYKNPDFIWYQDLQDFPVVAHGWPQAALALLWRPIGEDWLPEKARHFTPTLDPVALFPSIGWAFMAPSQPDPPFYLGFKNGTLAANHTHLDLNHVTVGWKETLLAVEFGSRPYPADYFSDKRNFYYEISTAGHNTLMLGGLGQVQGRPGELKPPVHGKYFDSVCGVADQAYEVPGKVRRHVVFIEKNYWVLLDEVSCPRPETAELRFHTLGTVKKQPGRSWTFEKDKGVLNLAFSAGLEGGVESVKGWIKPAKVLSLKAPAAREHLIATVLSPHAAGKTGEKSISLVRKGGLLTLSTAHHEVLFRLHEDGWQVSTVRRKVPR